MRLLTKFRLMGIPLHPRPAMGRTRVLSLGLARRAAVVGAAEECKGPSVVRSCLSLRAIRPTRRGHRAVSPEMVKSYHRIPPVPGCLRSVGIAISAWPACRG
jgi:hypothetical protein